MRRNTSFTDTGLPLFRIYWQDGRYSGTAIVSADTAEDARQLVQAQKPRASIHYPEVCQQTRGILTLG
ncbi:MAG: hypothetical protein KJ914_09485 [Gammaproteobacteria bacterium]|nr:hypothetical protein [Gammaproteobacteria bacterium]MBU1723461.1 hypothetical protein [Gammaproteobacteria bacterium]MBU2004417.1 hypothetical protein [Gammaproteobacteria bacterium]